MFYFFSHIGDYESLLMLLPKPPNEFCPSMKPESIALFISYKRGEKGTPLTDVDGNHVSDVFRHPMEEKCERCIEKNKTARDMKGVSSIADNHSFGAKEIQRTVQS